MTFPLGMTTLSLKAPFVRDFISIFPYNEKCNPHSKHFLLLKKLCNTKIMEFYIQMDAVCHHPLEDKNVYNKEKTFLKRI